MDTNIKLKQIRQGKSISLSNMAKTLGWKVSKLSKIENGNQQPTIKELEEMCKVLEISSWKLLSSETILNQEGEIMVNGISSKVVEILKNYSSVNVENFAGNEVVKIITHEIPQLINEKLKLDPNKFLIKGSGGNGQPAEVPWLSIFLRDITQSATKGFYLVFLFKADLTGVYLSLNQGFTYFREQYGAKEGRIKIKTAAEEIRRELKIIPNDETHIDLNCKNALGKGYEAGNIIAKYYDISDITDDSKLINDIQEYIKIYEVLDVKKGNRTVDEFYYSLLSKDDGYVTSDYEEVEYVNNALSNEGVINEECDFYGQVKEKKKPIVDNGGGKSYPRDYKVGANALKIANYKCEIDEKHPSFIRKSNGKNYTEPHHLIPISAYEDFEYSLDVEENICSICSTCHNCLHYGSDEEKIVLLEKLYNDRKELLEKVGLSISFEELKKYYDM